MSSNQAYLPSFEPQSDKPVSERSSTRRRKSRPAALNLPPGWERLSPREIEVAEHILRDLTDEQIAAALGVSVNTIRSHSRRLLQKTGFGRKSAFRRRYAPAEVFTASSNASLPPISPYLWSRLTRTQQQIVSMALHGLTDRAAAQRLEVGLPAVQATLRRALLILGIDSLSQLRASFCPPSSLASPLPQLPPLPGEARLPLTPRQRHVITLLLDHQPLATVASHLAVTPKAVKMMLARLQKRLDLPSSSALLDFFNSPPPIA